MATTIVHGSGGGATKAVAARIAIDEDAQPGKTGKRLTARISLLIEPPSRSRFFDTLPVRIERAVGPCS